LDAIAAKKYPTAEAYKQDIPNILIKLGFARDKAEYLANNIVVDPARGSGHAMGASMRSEKTHLRTRVETTGMNYKGFNIAVHEMGHNVEQTISLNEMDYTLLEGVPNTAFTEALAMVLQGHDLEVLGLAAPDAQTETLKTLNDFWNTYEISGVALVDMDVWHWMYDHPNASSEQLRDATLQIAKNIWNNYYAPVFGKTDVVLLAVYSHMIDSFMYLPDYPIGHLIAFQIEEKMRESGAIGPEFERMAKMGRVTPDMWMIHATGKPVGAEALLTATANALEKMQSAK
jgi:oligoendopeptidase F